MADTEGTGCGIKPLIFGGWAKSACEWHDNAYLINSWQELNMTRKEVDQEFLSLCLELAKSGKFKLGKRLMSYALYGVVRLLGGKYWEGER